MASGAVLQAPASAAVGAAPRGRAGATSRVGETCVGLYVRGASLRIPAEHWLHA